MPIYEYTCSNCNSEFELLIRGQGKAQEQAKCPSCGTTRLTKSMSVPAAHSSGNSGSDDFPCQSGPFHCENGQCGGGMCGMN